MTQDRIQSETEKAYFSQIPHILFDYDLSHTEFRLWCYYNRVGNCWQSVETTAKGAGMSMGAVSNARNGLESKGLIYVSQNDYGTNTVHVKDLWPENMAKYASPSKNEIAPSKFEGHPSENEIAPSKNETKNNPTIIIQEEESAPPPAKPTPKPTPAHYANMQARDELATLPEPIQALAQAISDVTLKPLNAKTIEAAYELYGRDAEPDDVRRLFSGAGCYWLTAGAGSWDDGNPRPYVGNITADWLRAVEWAESNNGGAWAELYAEHIAPLQSVDGAELKERVRLLPFDIKERLSEIGVKQAGQIARLSLAQFAGGA